jgi:hypothetical protein
MTLLNLPQGARELTQEERNFFEVLPNETRRLLIWAIDRTMDSHVDSSAIENRLAQELANTSSKVLKQALWVVDAQTQGYAALQAVQGGPSLDGGVVQTPPDSITNLLSKVQLPVKNLLVDRDANDYEVRLNTYIVAGMANTSFLNVDRQELQAWRNALADMTPGADSPNPAPTTIANAGGSSTQAVASTFLKIGASTPKPGPNDPISAAGGPNYTVVFTYKDGHTASAKGTIPNRCNNPGDIIYGNFAVAQGAIGRAGGDGNKRFAVFPNAQMGFAALVALLKTPAYQKLTLAEAINRYAPPSENNTSAYQQRVASQTGIGLTAKLGDVNSDQLTKLGNAIAKIEGFSTGAQV